MEQKIKRVTRELQHTGNIVEFYEDTIEIEGKRHTYYDFINHIGAAAIVPVTDSGEILMVKQYRNALDQFTLEVPAGALDAVGEPGIECARRELEEETGYRSERLEWLITIRTTVAFCNERIEIYVAHDLIPSEQKLDDNEFIEVKAYSIEELKEKIYSGEIQDSKTIAALLAYDTKYKGDK
jgi:ADP-ribose pyrophosphatase